MPNNSQKKRSLTVFPLYRLFPNMVTLAGMACGLTSIRFAMDGRFEAAVALLVAAAVIDGMDGRIARLLNSASMFGAQLDSLSDFVCFGVCPAIVMYLWKLHVLKGYGWALVLFFAMCCALRLARFNTSLLDESRQAWQMKFFTGIPSPAGAMLCLMPLVISFYAFPDGVNPLLTGLWVALIAILMPSRVPTFAVKKITVYHDYVLPVMLVCGAVIVMVLSEPWIMFTLAGAAYCAAIPFSMRYYRRLSLQYKPPAIAPVSPNAASLPE